MSLSGSPTDFGSVAVGTTSTKTVTVTAVREVTVTGVRATGDGFAAGPAELPSTLASGETLSVPVAFTPGGRHLDVRRAVVYDQFGNLGFDLHGSGSKDGLLATPAASAFGERAHQGGGHLNASITNTGTTTTTITSVTLPAASFPSPPHRHRLDPGAGGRRCRYRSPSRRRPPVGWRRGWWSHPRPAM